jgi:hypothetical protein
MTRRRNNAADFIRASECESCGMPLFGRPRFCEECTKLNNMVDVLRLHSLPPEVYRAAYCVYAIGPESQVHPVKIGVSTFVAKRFSSLQSASPLPLFILAVMRCPRMYEAKIHAVLAEDRVHGEWFKRTASVMELVDVLRQDDCDVLDQWLAQRPTKNQQLDSGYSLEQ